MSPRSTQPGLREADIRPDQRPRVRSRRFTLRLAYLPLVALTVGCGLSSDADDPLCTERVRDNETYASESILAQLPAGSLTAITTETTYDGDCEFLTTTVTARWDRQSARTVTKVLEASGWHQRPRITPLPQWYLREESAGDTGSVLPDDTQEIELFSPREPRDVELYVTWSELRLVVNHDASAIGLPTSTPDSASR